MNRILSGFAAAILIILCLAACNNSAEYRPDQSDSAVGPDSISNVDTAATTEDTSIKSDPDTGAQTSVTDTIHVDEPRSRKSATLGLSYFPQMHRNETRDVNVYVSVKYPTSLVRDTLKSIVVEQTVHYGDQDTSVIYTTNVIWYKTLDISLVDPANDFTITPIHPANKQNIDTVSGNRWRWSITTKTDKKEALMVLKVIAAKEDGTIDRFDDKTIVIRIKIDKNVFRVFLDYLLDNPKVSIPILVSLFGFLGWFIKYRLDKKKK